MAWICKKFNEINLKLQGTDVTLIGCKDALTLFIKKLDIFRHNLLQGEFHQFPELLTVKNHVTPEDIERFGNHLSELKLDMEKRFCDIFNLKVYDWMINPFTANAANVDVTFQEELLMKKEKLIIMVDTRNSGKIRKRQTVIQICGKW